MSKFFEYCSRCGKMFQDEKKWHEHQEQYHRKPAKVRQGMDKTAVQRKAKSDNLPQENQDVRLARTQELREMKRKLKAAGIECATLNADETEAVFENAKNKGIVE